MPTIKPEPAANFYIIYGLAFEALVKAMGDSSASGLSITCLRAMQSLVKPELSGNVFEGAFFDELCTVCYRIGMAESAVVKAEMCEVMAAFVVSRKGIMGCVTLRCPCEMQTADASQI